MQKQAISGRADAAVEAGLAGHGISAEDAVLLLTEAPLEVLCEAASAVRNRFKGRSVSYSKKVFLPLTHLCRDYCGYCTFRVDPRPGVRPYLLPDEVLAVAEAGRRLGCKEALFSLGDQPERLFPEAKAFLKSLGFSRTLEYLAAMCETVLRETGLLPHCNPGLMPREDLQRLRETNASVGLMLEVATARLNRPGGAHWKAPDKLPLLRLRTIENAGQLSMAFTTGILIGIGETLKERVDALLMIRSAHDCGGSSDLRRRDEHSISPKFACRRLSRTAEGGNERLGRNFPADQGLYQSRSRLAANLFAGCQNRLHGIRFARAVGNLSGILL